MPLPVSGFTFLPLDYPTSTVAYAPPYCEPPLAFVTLCGPTADLSGAILSGRVENVQCFLSRYPECANVTRTSLMYV